MKMRATYKERWREEAFVLGRATDRQTLFRYYKIMLDEMLPTKHFNIFEFEKSTKWKTNKKYLCGLSYNKIMQKF